MLKITITQEAFKQLLRSYIHCQLIGISDSNVMATTKVVIWVTKTQIIVAIEPGASVRLTQDNVGKIFPQKSVRSINFVEEKVRIVLNRAKFLHSLA